MHSTDPALTVLGSLLPIPAPFCSFHSMYRPCSYFLGSLVHIVVPFCSLYAFHRPCSYPLGSLLHMSAPLYSFYAFHRPSSYCLGILVPFCSLYAFHRSCSFKSLVHIISPLHSFCIPKSLVLLFRVISAHSCSILLFNAIYRPCSYSVQSLVLIPALLCSFYAIYRHCSYSLGSLLRILARFCSTFLHSTDLALTLYGHYSASQLHSAPFYAIYRPCS